MGTLDDTQRKNIDILVTNIELCRQCSYRAYSLARDFRRYIGGGHDKQLRYAGSYASGVADALDAQLKGLSGYDEWLAEQAEGPPEPCQGIRL